LVFTSFLTPKLIPNNIEERIFSNYKRKTLLIIVIWAFFYKNKESAEKREYLHHTFPLHLRIRLYE